MNLREIEGKVEEINQFIKNELWFDFELVEYKNGNIKVLGGGTHLTTIRDNYDIEIIFKDIFFTSLKYSWQSDTNYPTLIFHGYGTPELNSKFAIEQGYHVFEFMASDHLNSRFYIGAADIDFKINPNGYLKGKKKV